MISEEENLRRVLITMNKGIAANMGNRAIASRLEGLGLKTARGFETWTVGNVAQILSVLRAGEGLYAEAMQRFVEEGKLSKDQVWHLLTVTGRSVGRDMRTRYEFPRKAKAVESN